MDKKTLILIGMAFELTGLIIAFVYLGKYVDDQYGLKGLGTAGGAFLGLIIWVIHIMIVLKDDESKPTQ